MRSTKKIAKTRKLQCIEIDIYLLSGEMKVVYVQQRDTSNICIAERHKQYVYSRETKKALCKATDYVNQLSLLNQRLSKTVLKIGIYLCFYVIENFAFRKKSLLHHFADIIIRNKRRQTNARI